MTASIPVRKIARSALVLALFAALVLALLWFQGTIGRAEPELDPVPPPPALAPNAQTAEVEVADLPQIEVLPGFVEAVDPAALAARVMAPVLTVSRREGESFSRGDVLVTLDDRDAQARVSAAEAALAAAEAEATRAELDEARVQRLQQANAVTTRESEAARAARDAANAQAQRARQQLQEARTALDWYRLVAPFDGRVLERRVEPGSLAVPGQPLLQLYRPEALRFSVAVPEARAAGVTVDEMLAIEIAGEPRHGTITRILPAADPTTGTVTLHLALADPAGVRPGQLGRLELPIGTRQVLLVPAAAVRRIGQIEQVRIVQDGRVVPVTVRTGKQHGDRVEILSGLGAGENVVMP